MVTGGHLYDGQGIDSATIYDPEDETWKAAEPMQGKSPPHPPPTASGRMAAGIQPPLPWQMAASSYVRER
jgi:hypothetical protein